MKRATKDRILWTAIGVILGSSVTVGAIFVRLALFTEYHIL